MADQVNPNPEKDPGEWVTGEEPMTGPQASYLQTLCQEAGEPFDQSLSKAEHRGGSRSSRPGPVAAAPRPAAARPECPVAGPSRFRDALSAGHHGCYAHR